MKNKNRFIPIYFIIFAFGNTNKTIPPSTELVREDSDSSHIMRPLDTYNLGVIPVYLAP